MGTRAKEELRLHTYLASVHSFLGQRIDLLVRDVISARSPGEERLPYLPARGLVQMGEMHREVYPTCRHTTISRRKGRSDGGTRRTLRRHVTLRDHVRGQEEDALVVLQLPQEYRHERVPHDVVAAPLVQEHVCLV